MRQPSIEGRGDFDRTCHPLSPSRRLAPPRGLRWVTEKATVNQGVRQEP